MRDETTKQAAQEYLATKLAEENQKHETSSTGKPPSPSLSGFGRILEMPFSRSAASGTQSRKKKLSPARRLLSAISESGAQPDPSR